MSSAPIPVFFYISDEYKEIIKRVDRSIQNSEGVAVLDGPFGIGKSTLLRMIHELYNPKKEWETLFVNSAASYSSEVDIVTDLLRRFDLPSRKGLTSQYAELESFISKNAREGKSILILLDECHGIDARVLDCVQRLYNFEYSKRIVYTILAGEPEIQKKFSHKPAVRSRVNVWRQLFPMDVKESLKMVDFRCMVAGRKNPFMDEISFSNVFAISRGLPRYIIQICSDIINVVSETSNPGKGNTIPNKVVEIALNRFDSFLQINAMEE